MSRELPLIESPHAQKIRRWRGRTTATENRKVRAAFLRELVERGPQIDAGPLGLSLQRALGGSDRPDAGSADMAFNLQAG